jgi:hypothetical protein
MLALHFTVTIVGGTGHGRDDLLVDMMRLPDCCLQLQIEDEGLLPTVSERGWGIAAYSFRWRIRDCCLQLQIEDEGLLPTASDGGLGIAAYSFR